jgi:small subunit ribosomal protein S6e
VFLDKRLSEEVPADSLGDEFKGYVFKITGGYDKEGFSMMQGVMLNHRARLLLDGRTGQYTPKRLGCRKRKSVRGCIIGTDMSCINVTIVKRGETDLPKLTDKESDRPSTRGPKRANNIRKAWVCIVSAFFLFSLFVCVSFISELKFVLVCLLIHLDRRFSRLRD